MAADDAMTESMLSINSR